MSSVLDMGTTSTDYNPNADCNQCLHDTHYCHECKDAVEHGHIHPEDNE